MLITGVMLYLKQVTKMHDATAKAIGKLIDAVPNAGGTFGTDFVAFAQAQWLAVETMLKQQYDDDAASIKPLLIDGDTAGPFVRVGCSNAPPQPAALPAPSSVGLPGPTPTLKVRGSEWRA